MTPKFSMDLKMLDRHMHERISFVEQLNFPEIFWSKTSVKIMNKKIRFNQCKISETDDNIGMLYSILNQMKQLLHK